MKRKIIIVSGSRADYGLLRKLIHFFIQDPNFETYVAATGAHLSEQHGKTVSLLYADQIKNIIEVDMKLSGDQPEDISRSISNGIIEFSKVYQKIAPEAIVVLGDRYELWSACIPATVHNIPIVHIHGGESTQGVIDEAIRHSVTKMSHLHFCSHEEYRNRITRMGESPERVQVVGATGLDRIGEMKFLTRGEIAKKLNVQFGDENILCTFHPVTLDAEESAEEVINLVQALEDRLQNKNTQIFITMPNADTNSSFIRSQFENLVKKYPNNTHSFVNLGDQLYLSLMKEVDLILGNSSSGIIEAPYLKKAVVNIGLRQAGRLCSEHVLQADGTRESIQSEIGKALSPSFQAALPKISSIYGTGDASRKIYEAIRAQDFKKIIFKTFNDGITK